MPGGPHSVADPGPAARAACRRGSRPARWLLVHTAARRRNRCRRPSPGRSRRPRAGPGRTPPVPRRRPAAGQSLRPALWDWPSLRRAGAAGLDRSRHSGRMLGPSISTILGPRILRSPPRRRDTRPSSVPAGRAKGANGRMKARESGHESDLGRARPAGRPAGCRLPAGRGKVGKRAARRAGAGRQRFGAAGWDAPAARRSTRRTNERLDRIGPPAPP